MLGPLGLLAAAGDDDGLAQNWRACMSSKSSRHAVLNSRSRSMVPLFAISRSSAKLLSASRYASKIFRVMVSALSTTGLEDKTRILLSFA